MRIIGGQYGGYKIQGPKTAATRPISDRAKESLFNMLGDIAGLSFVDAYAGSGSVGLEAISRAAEPVVAVESGREAVATIQVNAQHLGVANQLEVRQLAVESWLAADARRFDIVFADPPFQAVDEVVLLRLAERAEQLFIYKHARRTRPIDIPERELVRSRRYGDSVLSFYR
ncbi:MAG: 16S rRNA (guanine(966)-N(2))-methyltransferase RsmD [Candidatus Saccharimonadales bacterium]